MRPPAVASDGEGSAGSRQLCDSVCWSESEVLLTGNRCDGDVAVCAVRVRVRQPPGDGGVR